MLQIIRDKAQGWIAWIIVILISIPFALWGIQEYLGAGGDPVVAKIDGAKITQQELDSAIHRQRANLRERLGAGYDPEQFPDALLRQQVLGGMIRDRVIGQTAADLGLRAGDAMVRSQILQIPAFQSGGRFDTAAYESALRAQGYTAASFEESLRDDLASMLLESGIASSALVTDRDLNDYLRLRDQTRDIGVVTVKAAAFVSAEAPADNAIRAYYEENTTRFMRPERVKIEYLELDRDKLAESVSVDEDGVAALYDAHRAEYVAPEQRRIRHILVTVEGDDADSAALTTAESIGAQLRDGADFAELAKVHSKDPGSAAKGGDLGLVGRGVMVAPFEDAAFTLAQGDISDPVKTQFGYHVIQVTEIVPERVQTLEEARARIEAAYRQQEAEHLFYDKAERLTDLTYEQPDSLTSAAEALGLEVQQSDWLTRSGGGAGVLASPKVTAAAFDEDVLGRGNNSEPIELDTTHLVVLRTLAHEEAAPKPLDEVRYEIIAALRQSAAAAVAAERAGKIVEAVASGASLADAASADGFVVEEKAGLTRRSRDLSPELVDAAFRAAAGVEGAPAKADNVVLPGGDHAVFVVRRIADADPAALDAEEKAAVKKQIAARRAQREFDLFVAQRQAETNIEITAPAVEPGR